MLFSHSLALCSRTRAAKKHAKVLLFSDLAKYLTGKVPFFCKNRSFFFTFFILLLRLCKNHPCFAIFSPPPFCHKSTYSNHLYTFSTTHFSLLKNPFSFLLSPSNNSATYQLQRSDLLTTPSRFHLSVSTFFVMGCQCAQRILSTQTKYNPRIDKN